MTSVIVTPMSPPFEGAMMFFEFYDGDKRLAVSKEDGELIKAMLSGSPKGRQIVLSAEGEKIRVSVMQ